MEIVRVDQCFWDRTRSRILSAPAGARQEEAAFGADLKKRQAIVPRIASDTCRAPAAESPLKNL
jgi:hypothetical protein